jgi:hypothetical protein
MVDLLPINGRVTAPDYTLPDWAHHNLHLIVWDRDDDSETPILQGALNGPAGNFSLMTTQDAQLSFALVGQREGPQHLASIGWGAALDPLLTIQAWPNTGGAAGPIALDWDGTVKVRGYVEQLHIQEIGGLPLAVLELVGHTLPVTYQRLPPLPLPALGDRHGLHTDRHLDDRAEQVYYLLADAESPLAAIAQDALVSSLRVVCVASLGMQEAGWQAIVNVPLVLDEISLIAP